MVDNKPKDDNPVRSSDVRDVYDAVKDNFIRAIDEMAKVQPQYSQSISNLQLDYIQSVKNIIHAGISAQKQVASNWNIPISGTYIDQFTKQSNEITNNTIRAVGINNQLTINSLDAARENLKIYTRTVDAITEFNSNLAKAWGSFFSQQQQYLK